MENEKVLTENEQRNEVDVYKAIAFYLVRLHRIAPEGRKQKKSKREVDTMSYRTIEYMAKNLDKKIFDEYLKAKSLVEK